MSTGLGGDASGGQPAKVAEYRKASSQIEQLTKLAQARDSLQRSVLGTKLNKSFDPEAVDMSYFAGLFA